MHVLCRVVVLSSISTMVQLGSFKPPFLVTSVILKFNIDQVLRKLELSLKNILQVMKHLKIDLKSKMFKKFLL